MFWALINLLGKLNPPGNSVSGDSSGAFQAPEATTQTTQGMEEVMRRFSSHDLRSPSGEEGVDPLGGWAGSISCNTPQASEDPSEGC